VKLRMYVPSWRTCLRWLEVLLYEQAAGPKRGKVLGPYNHAVYGIHSEGDPVQSTRPNATQNGHAERWNPPTALPAAGVGGQAVCLGGEDGSRSECLIVMMRIC
jgi:hypothetical protein